MSTLDVVALTDFMAEVFRQYASKQAFVPKVQPGAAWPAHALHEPTDARGQPRWVVDELRPRWAGRPWVLTLARAELWCADEDRRDDALATV